MNDETETKKENKEKIKKYVASQKKIRTEAARIKRI